MPDIHGLVVGRFLLSVLSRNLLEIMQLVVILPLSCRLPLLALPLSARSTSPSSASADGRTFRADAIILSLSWPHQQDALVWQHLLIPKLQVAS